MHVVHRLEQLIHVVLDALLLQVLPPPTDELIDVHIHQLEDQRQPARGLIIQDLAQLDHPRVGRQPAQRLDLSQVVHLQREAARARVLC